MTESQRKELGLFRTPLGAALFSGVLVGFSSMAWIFLWPRLRTITDSTWLLRLNMMLLEMFVNIAFLSGPAIAGRSLGRLAWASLFGLIMSAMTSFSYEALFELVRAGVRFGSLNATFKLFQLAQVVIVTALLCRVLCGLYGLRNRSWLIYVAGIAVKLVLMFGMELITFGRQQAGGQTLDAQDLEVMHVMSTLVLDVIWVVLPTLLIERALRKQATLDAATSAVPATAPTASDANNATR